MSRYSTRIVAEKDPAGVSAARWWAKKLGRSAFLEFHRRRLRSQPSGDPPLVHALTYHRFGDHARRDPFTVTRESFRSQMSWLAENRLAVSLDDVLGYVRGSSTVRDGSVLVTIDDGSQSAFDIAAPILAEFAIPAVAFVVTDLVGRGGAAASMPEPFMTWEDVARLPEFGVEVGSHGRDHRSLGRMTAEEVYDQIAGSRATMMVELGQAPRCFAYPFGTPAHVGLDARVAVQAADYDLAFTSVHGRVTPFEDPLLLPRVKIESGETLAQFQTACDGGLDGWRVVDSWLSEWTRFKWKREAPNSAVPV